MNASGTLTGKGSMSGKLAAAGSISGDIATAGQIEAEAYKGPYTVDPEFDSQVLETQGKLMTENVVVNEIEVARISNQSGGTTVYIGGII